MQIRTHIALLLLVIGSAGCDTRSQRSEVASPSAPTPSPSTPDSRPRGIWSIYSEEIQNPDALVRGGTLRVRLDPDSPTPEIQVTLPATTPYVSGSPKEIAYFKGYAIGFLDATFPRVSCRSNAGDKLLAGYMDGWTQGYADGDKKKKAA